MSDKIYFGYSVMVLLLGIIIVLGIQEKNLSMGLKALLQMNYLKCFKCAQNKNKILNPIFELLNVSK